MKDTIKQMASVVLAVVSISSVSWAEKGFPRFYLDYAVVQNRLKNNVGNWDEFMKLAKLDRKSTDFIAKFWWAKAQKECDDFTKGLIKRYASRIATEASKEEKEKLLKAAKEESDQCFYGVYYNHWGEINQMVVQKYEAALAEKNK